MAQRTTMLGFCLDARFLSLRCTVELHENLEGSMVARRKQFDLKKIVRKNPHTDARTTKNIRSQKPHVGAKKLKCWPTESWKEAETRMAAACAGHATTTLHRTECVWQCAGK
jgi:hypothetical protein